MHACSSRRPTPNPHDQPLQESHSVPARESPSIPNYVDPKHLNDFVKVWAQCVAKQAARSGSQVNNQTNNGYRTPSTHSEPVGIQRPPTPVEPRASRWSRPPDAVFVTRGRQLTTGSSRQLAPASAYREDDKLESPIVLQAGRPRPSNNRIVLPIPSHLPQLSHSTPSTMDSVRVDTPASFVCALPLQQQGMLPSVEDEVDQVTVQANTGFFRSGWYMGSPSQERVRRSVNALYRMHMNAKTDYTQPPQALLAISLISDIPPNADLMPYESPSNRTTWVDGELIKDIVTRFAMGIYRMANEFRLNDENYPVGSAQMLWNLHDLALRRWGEDSLLAGHTEVLARDLWDRSPK